MTAPRPPAGGGRRAILGLATGLLVLLAAELVCWAFFTATKERFELAAGGDDVLKPERIPALRTHFDPALGWTRAHPTPHGERPRPRDFGRPFLMTFGDSFTQGDEVGDDETWQTYLADLFQADVYNFGVGGYGADQAYLRYTIASRELRTPVVTLGFVLESIDRVVSVYRKFQYPATGIPLTKPRFVLKDARLELKANPVSRAEDLSRLADPRFVASLGRDDHWYRRSPRPRLAFPYTALLLHPRIWAVAFRGGESEAEDRAARPSESLWQHAPSRALFLAILDAFARDAAGAGSRPLLLVFPRGRDLKARLRGESVAGLDAVMERCRERGYLCFDGIGALASVAGGGETRRFYRPGGHLSPRGNRAFARKLAEFLGAAELLP